MIDWAALGLDPAGLTSWQRELVDRMLDDGPGAYAKRAQRISVEIPVRNGRVTAMRYAIMGAAFLGQHVHYLASDGAWCVTWQPQLGLLWAKLPPIPPHKSRIAESRERTPEMIEVGNHPGGIGAVMLHSTESGQFLAAERVELERLAAAIKRGDLDAFLRCEETSAVADGDSDWTRVVQP